MSVEPSFAHEVISSHWAPSWLITLAVYSKIVVSIYYHRYFKRIMDFNCENCSSTQIKNTCFAIAMCLENQPRWRRLERINIYLEH